MKRARTYPVLQPSGASPASLISCKNTYVQNQKRRGGETSYESELEKNANPTMTSIVPRISKRLNASKDIGVLANPSAGTVHTVKTVKNA